MNKTTPAQFVRQVRQEMSKVTWPSRRETLTSGATVIVMVTLAALFLFTVDQILGWLVKVIFGVGG